MNPIDRYPQQRLFISSPTVFAHQTKLARFPLFLLVFFVFGFLALVRVRFAADTRIHVMVSSLGGFMLGHVGYFSNIILSTIKGVELAIYLFGQCF